MVLQFEAVSSNNKKQKCANSQDGIFQNSNVMAFLKAIEKNVLDDLSLLSIYASRSEPWALQI